MLPDRDREILAFEAAHSGSSGWKDGEILARFGMSPTRYYQLLNVILENPAALDVMPQDVIRLRRLRSERLSAREARRFAA